jgi:nucleoid DNA-binding protein
LNPTKPKKIVTATSKELGLSEELIDEVISFYYKAVHRKLSSLEHYNIQVIGLGSFSLRRMRLEKKTEHYQNALAKFEKEMKDDPSMRQYGSVVRVRSQLEILKNVLEMHNKELQRKLEKKEEKRKFNSENNELDKNLEI